MKTKKTILSILLYTGTLGILFNSCKKDRVPLDDYQNMDSFYNDHKEEEQEFVIDSTGGSCFIIAKKGTRICVTRSMLSFPNGTDITYPFTLKVVELYSIKDMILWRLPAISGGNLLETSAEIRVRAFKNNSELILKPGKAYYMEMANMPVINNNMQVYYGYDNNNVNDWTNSLSSIIPGFVDTLSSVTATPAYYSLEVARLGWVSSARLHVTGAQNTTIILTVPGTNTQNIEVFLSFTNFKGLMKITNLLSGSVPVGEQVTLVAFGKKQTNDFVLHQQNFSITANQQVPLAMQVISENDLLAALDAL